MCGLVGYTGKTNFNFTAGKFMTTLMEDRGRTSVGVLLGSYTFKDLGNPQDFFKKWIFPVPKTMKVALIHNRAPSKGLSTKANAHPFHYKIQAEDGQTYSAYFAHNGTLTNCDELCEKYKIEKNRFDTDSELLGYIITHYGFDVLKEYKGAAAFFYTREDQPNELYVWKGCSRQNTETIEEERPLYFANVKGGVYFASTEPALRAALDLDEKNPAIEYPDNTLTRYNMGEIVETTVYDRSHIEKKTYASATNAYNQGRAADQPPFTTNVNQTNGTRNKITKLEKKKEKLEYSLDNPEPDRRKFYDKDEIYYRHGRYYVNGQLANGELKITVDDNIVINELTDCFWEEEKKTMCWLPSDYVDTGVNCEYKTYYFLEGFWMQNEEAINLFHKIGLRKTIYENVVSYDQRFCLHPNAHHFAGSASFNKSLYYIAHNDIRYNGTFRFQPMFSKYEYILDVNNNIYYTLKVDPKDPAIERSSSIKVELFPTESVTHLPASMRPDTMTTQTSNREIADRMAAAANGTLLYDEEAYQSSFGGVFNEDDVDALDIKSVEEKILSEIEKTSLDGMVLEDLLQDVEQLKNFIRHIGDDWDLAIQENHNIAILVTGNSHFSDCRKFIKALQNVCNRKDLINQLADEAPF